MLTGLKAKISSTISKITTYLKEKATPVNVALVVLIILVGYAAWAFFEHSPAANVFCATCHVMKPFYEEFQESPHRQFNCHVCHVFDLETAQGTIRELYLTITGQAPDPEELRLEARLHIEDECLQCHRREDLAKLPLHNIHLEVAEIADSCTFCHSSHLLKPHNSDCTQCHDLERMLEKHKGYHRYAFAITILEEQNVTRNLPPEVLDIIKEVAGPSVECYRCHGETATWNVPLDPQCYVGALEGKTCLDCHKDLPEIDISDDRCTECHRK
ncbi:Nitrate/TMAO reductase, membrane-bound tetraheme cytochrome c subunit [Pyrodictium delaneyi]|uniref:Nitrate/TMAO reductase, membrane-bound tetraheme cytochrome c subunit n=1 Tax=Pyrodictium delaneyi TaxID=1273541 RepID=A0A0P0N1P0_9CREN|nr:Nitrate/TMAO reductase, membrane-bound tetraheme cytochrome c subunit [Pyrodictium delaneyi]